MLDQHRRNPPARIGLYVGSGSDIYHALEFCTAATSLGLDVRVLLSESARSAVPENAWLSVGTCRDATTDDKASADHFRRRDVAVIAALCFSPETDGDRVAQLAASVPAVAVEPLSAGQGPRLAPPAVTAAGAPFAVVTASDHEPAADYVTLVCEALRFIVSRAQGALRGKRIVVTAGGTREPLDPVRFITNRSSGLMGHAIALAATDYGADVVLVSSASALPAPCGATRIRFHDVQSLRAEVLIATTDADALIMAAAVSDYRPKTISPQKIKKSAEGLTLELATIPNFIPEIPPGVLRVGFAAETDPDPTKAAMKLSTRGFDMLCLNDVSRPDAGFEVDTNALWILDRGGVRTQTPLLPKTQIAQIVLEHTSSLLLSKQAPHPR